jgi:8-oxo-dGTP pyrophosphatase MutT (NUDIX family)
VTYRSALLLLQAALKAPLPGRAAQDMLAPRPRRDWPQGFDTTRIRHAAGLLLLFPLDDRAHIILTVRANSLERHGGQVSLPGGVIEADETVEQAALREAREEIGLDIRDVRTLGTLTPLDIPVSGFRLHPVVATIERRPDVAPAEGEVARILEVAVESLLDPNHFGRRPLLRDGRVTEVPAFRTDGVEIWGATAMSLAEFLSVLGWPGPPAE